MLRESQPTRSPVQASSQTPALPPLTPAPPYPVLSPRFVINRPFYVSCSDTSASTPPGQQAPAGLSLRSLCRGDPGTPAPWAPGASFLPAHPAVPGRAPRTLETVAAFSALGLGAGSPPLSCPWRGARGRGDTGRPERAAPHVPPGLPPGGAVCSSACT